MLRSSFTLKLSAAVILVCLSAGAFAAFAQGDTYTVQPRDTLDQIAAFYQSVKERLKKGQPVGAGELADFERLDRDRKGAKAGNFGYAGLTVALSQTMLLEADYRYERVDQTSFDATADSNNFILWLVYQPTETVW